MGVALNYKCLVSVANALVASAMQRVPLLLSSHRQVTGFS